MGRGTCEANQFLLVICRHPVRSYSICTAVQRHFTDAVMPVLRLEGPENESKRSRLERCIREVSHTRHFAPGSANNAVPGARDSQLVLPRHRSRDLCRVHARHAVCDGFDRIYVASCQVLSL